MCGGLEYEYIDTETGELKRRKVFFPIPNARVPVVGEEGGEAELCVWGRRKEETEYPDLPEGGWARLISLKEGKWNRYNPRKVRIPAVRWMEKDGQRKSHWFEMAPGQSLLGVQVEVEDRKIVYVVTRPAEVDFADIHERMPMIVAAPAGMKPPVAQGSRARGHPDVLAGTDNPGGIALTGC